jgi:hypothetical protein
MSAEKGLAWFDLGNGKIVKGRSFWFNSNLPETWEGREFIVHPEKFEVDEIGLSDWVDEQILSQEQDETSQNFAPKPKAAPEPTPSAAEKRAGGVAPPKPASPQPSDVIPDGPFKLNTGSRGLRPRGSVMTVSRPSAPPPASTVKTASGTAKPKNGAQGKGATQSAEQGGSPDSPKGPKPGPFKFRK